MKGEKEMPFVRNPAGPVTGRGVSSKTSRRTARTARLELTKALDAGKNWK